MKCVIRPAIAGGVISVIVITFTAVGSWEAKAAPKNPPTQTVLVENPSTVPVPVYAAPASFKKVLVYDQTAGTFPSFEVPANQRIIIRQINVGALVSPGTVPVASVNVTPPLLPAIFQEEPVMTKISNFQNVQDRYIGNDSTFVILEAGEKLNWFIADAAGEFSTPALLTGFVSLSGEVVSLTP
jgi:hypothetical protein